MTTIRRNRLRTRRRGMAASGTWGVTTRTLGRIARQVKSDDHCSRRRQPVRHRCATGHMCCSLAPSEKTDRSERHQLEDMRECASDSWNRAGEGDRCTFTVAREENVP
jgi:hypothetical protein